MSWRTLSQGGRDEDLKSLHSLGMIEFSLSATRPLVGHSVKDDSGSIVCPEGVIVCSESTRDLPQVGLLYIGTVVQNRMLGRLS